MKPGTYRAKTRIVLTLAHRNGGAAARVVQDSIYQPGEVFTLGETVNDFYYRVTAWGSDSFQRTGDPDPTEAGLVEVVA